MFVNSFGFFWSRFVEGLRAAKIAIPVWLILCFLWANLGAYPKYLLSPYIDVSHWYLSFALIVMTFLVARREGVKRKQYTQVLYVFIPVFVITWPAFWLIPNYKFVFLDDRMIFLSNPGFIETVSRLLFDQSHNWPTGGWLLEKILRPLDFEIRRLPYLTFIWLMAATAVVHGFGPWKQIKAVCYFFRCHRRFVIFLCMWLWVLFTLQWLAGQIVYWVLWDEALLVKPVKMFFWGLSQQVLEGLFYTIWISLFIGCIAKRKWIERLCTKSQVPATDGNGVAE